mgnify:CR=1 FL=1
MDFASLTMFVNTMFYPPAPPQPQNTHTLQPKFWGIYIEITLPVCLSMCFVSVAPLNK